MTTLRIFRVVFETMVFVSEVDEGQAKIKAIQKLRSYPDQYISDLKISKVEELYKS
jgi:hypothetical protein